MDVPQGKLRITVPAEFSDAVVIMSTDANGDRYFPVTQITRTHDKNQGWTEVKFRTTEELTAAIAGKQVYETPAGFADVIPGIRIFSLFDSHGLPTGEYAVYVKDQGASPTQP